MALILAINPGNSHSPTLARLARELKGDELIGADSCTVAIAAIKSRVPDLVLLPDKSPRGEPELLARLRTIKGGVPMLKLPPVGSADPAALAKDIRAMLTRETRAAAPSAAPAGPSPHVVAAARAAVTWIHLRRAQWAAEAAHAISEPDQPDEPYELPESNEPKEPLEADEPQEPIEAVRSRWLPRAALIAVVIGGAAAAAWFWPAKPGVARAPAAPAATRQTAPPPPAPSASAEYAPAVPTAAPDAPPNASITPPPAAAEPASGWVAVSAPFDVTIASGDQPVARDDRGRAAFAPGTHRLRFQNLQMGYDETRSVEVRPTATTRVNLTPETTIGVTSTEPAEVSIDGAPAGATPFEGKIGLGTRTVVVRGASGERRFTVEATMKPVRLEVDFSQPQL